MCTGAISEEMPWAASLLQINVSTQRCLLGVIALNVVTILCDNPMRCSFYMRQGTWQCWGNNSAKLETRYIACISGTK
jgi:hypothetical protein